MIWDNRNGDLTIQKDGSAWDNNYSMDIDGICKQQCDMWRNNSDRPLFASNYGLQQGIDHEKMIKINHQMIGSEVRKWDSLEMGHTP